MAVDKINDNGTLYDVEDSTARADITNLQNQILSSTLNYDNTSTYAINDYCIYNNNLYRCIVDITVAEDFTAAHWELTNVVADLTTINNTIGDINTVLEGVL